MRATVAQATTYVGRRDRNDALAVCREPLPCPFCGGTVLLASQWLSREDEEVPAYECVKCDASAPAAVWNRRISVC